MLPGLDRQDHAGGRARHGALRHRGLEPGRDAQVQLPRGHPAEGGRHQRLPQVHSASCYNCHGKRTTEVREDTHTQKRLFFSGRTTKVRVHPPPP